ncbi:PREDICTED: putative RING-H2 finger protein ATL37 [Camelina sativa]|uniref:RING-type E3 ubiquitin transferase n=1 Tax=Camelina sativa TaxID=90675 RepID=A0ABM0VFC2_CAMSA|nr:PREDICTED: putative RING-H2 finger protein ATL37 [Camelina sativa]
MTIIQQFIACTIFQIFFFPCLHCQKDWESTYGDKKNNFSTLAMVGIVFLGMFVTILLACCSFFAFFAYHYRRLIAEEGHEVLNNGTTTTGVEKEIIESFPSFLYSEVKRLKIGKGGVECAICLKEFEDEETLRWMPPCSHTFHSSCIDVWLSSQTTCPVCRANLCMKPAESFPYLSMDLERGNGRRGVVESLKEISLTDSSVTWNNNENDRTTRSRSTGFLSSSGMAHEILYPRSHSTGHSSVQLGKDLNRFTLQLPEEVQRQIFSLNLIRRSHMALPQAMSSRQGYRSGCVVSERNGFSQGKQTLRQAISKSLSFSFQADHVPSTIGWDDLLVETSQVKDKDLGEQSFQRLMPENV